MGGWITGSSTKAEKSFWGKILLIKHVLSSIPIFLLQVIVPPKVVFKTMGRLFNRFLWDKGADRRIHWKSWESLCYPVEEGGLGFRSLTDVADSFAMKLWWKLRLNESIWASYMHLKYIKSYHPMEVQRTVGSSTWTRLLRIRVRAEEHIFWQLGKGMVDFWRDKWATEEPLSVICEVDNPPFCFVAEFFYQNSWDADRLSQWLPEHLVVRISEIVVDQQLPDTPIWNFSSNGRFTAASAYDWLRGRRNISMVSRLIWNPLVPLKISFLAWRIFHKTAFLRMIC